MDDCQTALRLWVILSRTHASLTAHAEADVARHGLSLADFAALEALYHKGPLLVGALQRAVLKSSGGITYVIDRLERKGFVRRRPCPEDRRAVYAELTAEGEELLDRIFPEHAAALTTAQGELTAAEKAEAADLLKRLGLGAERRPLPGDAGRMAPRTGFRAPDSGAAGTLTRRAGEPASPAGG